MRITRRLVGPAGRMALAVAVAMGASGTGVAYAAAAQQSSTPPEQLAEIVVTATKRVTTIQTTPATIMAVTASEIASRGLVDFNSLAQSVPGLSMRTSGPGQTEFEMRGLDSSGGNTSMVGFYLGGIPLSSPAVGQLGKIVIDPDLYDLDRVEVLQGPQGTLYGASSMGGTVRLVPNPPELNKFDATGEEVISDSGDGGGLNHEENAMLNLPLGSTAAVRVVGSFDNESGWIKRLVLADGAVPVDVGVFPDVTRPADFYTAPLQETIDGANMTEVDSMRASLLWQPNDNLTVTPLVMYQLTQQGAPSTVDVNGDSPYPSVPAVNAHWEIYDTSEPQRDRFTLGSLTVNYRLPWFSVTSDTGLWNRDTLVSQDASEEDAAAIGLPTYDPPAGIGPTGPAPNGPGATEREYSRQTSEELRATSTLPGRFQWIVGYFYQDLYTDWNLWVVTPQSAPIYGGTSVYVQFIPETISQNAEFGEFSYQLTTGLKATIGFRHFYYSLSQSSTEFGLFTVNAAQGNDIPFDSAASNSASGTVPKFDLMYQLNSNDILYATLSKGFRLGGVNWAIPVASPGTSTNQVLVGDECGLQAKLLNNAACNYPGLLQAPTTYGSDTVWNYELGEKSAFFHHRMTLDVSAYYERWLHPQVATNIDGFGITATGGDAQIKGAEAELRALLTDDWDITLNYGYTNARFIQSSAIVGFPTGLAIPDTPKYTASAVLHYAHDIDAGLSVFGSLEWDYVGSRTDAPYGETLTLWNYGDLLIHLPSYDLANLRVGLRGIRWTAALFVDNVTDKEALLDPEPQIALQTAAYARYTVTRPRTIGVDLTYRFD